MFFFLWKRHCWMITHNDNRPVNQLNSFTSRALLSQIDVHRLFIRYSWGTTKVTVVLFFLIEHSKQMRVLFKNWCSNESETQGTPVIVYSPCSSSVDVILSSTWLNNIKVTTMGTTGDDDDFSGQIFQEEEDMHWPFCWAFSFSFWNFSHSTKPCLYDG